MTKLSPKIHIILSVILVTCTAGFVDGVLQPPYFQRAAMKAALFTLIPMCYFVLQEKKVSQVETLLLPKKREFLAALALGLGVFGLITGGYLILTKIYDISELVLKLTADAGVGADNFLYVSLYISLVNSLLEEFLFRGFAFLTLRKFSGRRFAYCFSALTFAVYHLGMMAAGSIWISMLALVGLFIAGCLFNWLDERGGSIITSWLVHMFANFAINTIGFMIFGMI